MEGARLAQESRLMEDKLEGIAGPRGLGEGEVGEGSRGVEGVVVVVV